jgi:TonB family protein
MRGLWLTAVLAIALPASAADAPPTADPMSPAPLLLTIEDLDRGLANFKSMIWASPGSGGNPPPDHTGKTIEEDLAAYVLGEAPLARIAAERARLAAIAPPGSGIIPPDELRNFDMLMTAESCRFAHVVAYWLARVGGAYHDDLIHTLLARLPAVSNASSQTSLQALGLRINALRNTLPVQIAACNTESAPPPPDITPVLKDYNALRLQLVAALPAAEKTGMLIRRSSSCPPPAATSGTERATLIGKLDLNEIYPPEAIRYEVEGRVRVRVEIDATGCVVGAAVEETTGAAVLDSAGVEYAFGLQFAPPTADGKTIATTATVPIVFRFAEEQGDQP